MVDPFGLDETTSTIVGRLDSGVLLLNEIDIMSTRSTVLENEFCLLQMRLRFKEENGFRYLNGVFNGYYSDSVICVNGSLMLVDSMSYVSPIAREVVRQELRGEKENVRVLSREKGLSFQTESNELVIFVWDSGIIDGDEVSIYCNDSVVLDRYLVKKKKKKLRIALNNGLNTIKIKAISEGIYSPNTTMLQLKGNGGLYNAVTFLHANEETGIRVKSLVE